MNNKKDESFNGKKKLKNEYFSAIGVISLAMAFTFAILLVIQSMMGVKNVTITDNAGDQYYYEGKFQEAITEYTKMQEKEQWPIWTVKAAEAYSVNGNIMQSNNLLKEAMVKRDEAMLNSGDKYIEEDKELINEVIFTFYINNELDQAESLGEYYLTTYSTYKPLLKTMFAIYLAKGNEKAAKEIVDAYSVDNESAYDLAVLAQMQIILDNYDDALDNLKKAYTLDKNEIKIYDVIMETCEFNKEKLLKKVSSLAEKNKEDEAYKVWLKEINSIDESNNNLAENILNEINSTINIDELDKDSYVYKYIEAWECYSKGQYDKALEYCKEAILANKDYSNTYGILMPKILIATENITMIDGYFRTAIYNEPYNYNLIANIGEIYSNDLSNYDKAAAYFNLALSLNSKEDSLYYDLANMNIVTESYEDAIKDLKKAISLDDSKGKYYRALGVAYFNINENDNAIESFRKAYSLNEKDVLALNNAACYYVMVDKDVWRGYSNIEAAYNGMGSNIDEESKELITNNYNLIKDLYNKYVNNENTPIQISGLELAY